MLPTPLHETELDRSRLNIFVCGPGFGETIVIGLPKRGWVVIDGAGAKGDYPAHTILETHAGDEPIDLVLLTHPHRDHRCGLRALLSHAELGPQIRKVGCVAALAGTPAKSTLAGELASRTESHADAADEQLWTGELRALFERVRSLWADRPETRLRVEAGVIIPSSSEAVQLQVLAPTSNDIAQFFAVPDISRRLLTRANDLSAVIHLTYGDHRYVFGADLPELVGGAVVPSGWRSVLSRDTGLHTHAFLKLPHHGSDEAQPSALLKASTSPRTWALTPFNTSTSLPSFAAGHGARALVALHSPVHLTALPRDKSARAPLPAELSAATVTNGTVALRGGLGPGVTPRPAGRNPSTRAVDGYWLFTFDDSGACVSSSRGCLSTKLTA